MHIYHHADIEPVNTPNGEVIHELIGRGMATPNDRHSLAYIVLPAGQASVPHYHPIAEESYYILSGAGVVRLGEEERAVSAGEAILIPPTMIHQISNPHQTDLVFLAICVPAWEVSNSVFV